MSTVTSYLPLLWVGGEILVHVRFTFKMDETSGTDT